MTNPETQIKERPILFNAEMVRAILDGRKTQTRRVIKPQPNWIAEPNIPFKTNDADPKGIIKCPYGQPGDRLWVRETATYSKYGALWGAFDHAEVKVEYHAGCAPDCNPYDVQYIMVYDDVKNNFKPGKKPSIFMPRWAPRIFLKVVSVRVERVQDISDEDAKEEGVKKSGGWNADETECKINHRGPFSHLWDSINKKRGFGWDVNPLVWVVEFKRIEQES